MDGLDEELAGQFQGAEHQLVLHEGVVDPVLADVGRAVVQHHVGLPRLQLLLQVLVALLGRDVLLQRRDTFRSETGRWGKEEGPGGRCIPGWA